MSEQTERCTCNDRPTTRFYCEVHHVFVQTVYMTERDFNHFTEAVGVLHCSCGAALTEEEYREHRSQGHDAPILYA